MNTAQGTSNVDLSKMAFLGDMSSMIIKQPVRGKELFFEQCLGCEMSNYYEAEEVKEDGNTKTTTKLFVFHEESNCCLRQCCGASRPLVLNAVLPEQDPESEPMFQVIKPYRMGCCCIPPLRCQRRGNGKGDQQGIRWVAHGAVHGLRHLFGGVPRVYEHHRTQTAVHGLR